MFSSRHNVFFLDLLSFYENSSNRAKKQENFTEEELA